MFRPFINPKAGCFVGIFVQVEKNGYGIVSIFIQCLVSFPVLAISFKKRWYNRECAIPEYMINVSILLTFL